MSSRSRERLPKVITPLAAAIGGAAVGSAVGSFVRGRKIRQHDQVAHRFIESANARADKAEAAKKEAEEKSKKDSLTKLYNRPALAEAYQGLVTAASRPRGRGNEIEAKRTADKHSLLMLDIDRFKETNDTLGHNEGDEILREVADIVIKRVRQRDVPVRWGGEEILVLLPRATEEDAANTAEELRASIEATGRAKASFGVAELDPNLPLDDNIALVDNALYSAKENGRNQVVAYSSLAPKSSVH